MARELIKTIESTKRNLLINGNFAISQRGDSLATSGAGTYLMDRWEAWTSSAGSVSGGEQRQSSLPAGFPGVFNQTGSGQGNCHRLFATVNDFTQGSSFLRRQKVESIRLKDGNRDINTVSAGVWVYGNNMQSATIQIFTADAEDNFTSITLAGQNTVSINDDEWTYVTLENVSLPNTNGIEIRISLGTPTANVFTDTYIAEVMLNEGSSVEPFVTMGQNFDEELQFCLRYYEKSYPINVEPGTVTSNGRISFNDNGSRVVATVFYTVRKRANPQITIYSPATGNSGVSDDDGVDRTATLSSQAESSFSFSVNFGDDQTIQYTSEAEL